MPIRELKDQIARLPEQPGVYLYFNASGDTIYVGKARALRDRVRNYLGAYGNDPKTDALLDEVVRLEVIVTEAPIHLRKRVDPETGLSLIRPRQSRGDAARGHQAAFHVDRGGHRVALIVQIELARTADVDRRAAT